MESKLEFSLTLTLNADDVENLIDDLEHVATSEELGECIDSNGYANHRKTLTTLYGKLCEAARRHPVA